MNRILTLSLAALTLLSAGYTAVAAPVKPAAKPAAKSAKPAAKPDAKADEKPDARPDEKPDVQSAYKPAGSVEMQVSFQTSGTPPHDVTARPKGALDSSGTGQVFTLIDLNGGALASGDKVQIELAPGGKGRPSFWQENKDKKITRIGGHPDSKCLFTVNWKQKNKTLTLKTAGGLYVSAPAGGGPIATTAKATDPTAVFTLVKAK